MPDGVVGSGQSTKITVKASRKVRVVKTATTATVRTKHAPRGKVKVRIVASGVGFTPVTWSRSWRVR